MYDHGYPDILEHQSQHLSLVESLASYDLQLKANPQINLQQLTASLHSWILQHILVSDKRLGDFLRQGVVE